MKIYFGGKTLDVLQNEQVSIKYIMFLFLIKLTNMEPNYVRGALPCTLGNGNS